MRSLTFRLHRAVLTIVFAIGLVTPPTLASGTDLKPSRLVTTAHPGGEDSFGPSSLRITGYVLNHMMEAAVDVTLLIQVFDSTGALSAQHLQLLASMLPARSRLRFESPRLPFGDRFRVTVWSWGAPDPPRDLQ